mgnify:CR=1 FL=1
MVCWIKSDCSSARKSWLSTNVAVVGEFDVITRYFSSLGSGDFVDQALAAAAKVERERHGRDIEIMTISADDLRKAPQRPGAAIIQHEGALSNIHTTQTSATAKHKHQLTSLLHEAKVEESRILEAGLKANQTRATNRRKYGW